MDKNRISAQQKNQAGVKYGTRGQYKKAIKQFKKSLKIDPKLPETYYFLGLASQNMGRSDEAIDYYKKAVKLKPDLSIAA